MEIISLSILKILAGMPHFAMLLLGLIAAKFFFVLTTSYNFNEELTTRDNPAFGVALAGYLTGSGVALAGTLFGNGHSLSAELLELLVVVVATLVLMRLSVWINDLAVLYRFSVKKELSVDRNVGTGFVLAGSSLATGAMLNGVLNGHSPSLLIGIRDIVVYWTLGQLILIAGGYLFQRMTRYDMHKIIGDDDNVPAGISFGGYLLALGLIIRSALFGAGSRLGEEIVITVVFAVVGLLLLVVTRIIVDRMFLPNSPLTKEVAEDRNPAAGAIAAASFIVVAILFTVSVNPHPDVPSAQIDEPPAGVELMEEME